MDLNLNKTSEDSHKPICGGGAEYLAAILPELAQIAITFGDKELSHQIDRAAQMAQKNLITRER